MKFTIEMSPEEAKELFTINNEKLFEIQKKIMEQMITKAIEYNKTTIWDNTPKVGTPEYTKYWLGVWDSK